MVLPSLIHAQVDSVPLNKLGNLELSEVISCDLTKEQLYSNAQEWIAKAFGDYKTAIQFDNKESGKLIVKGISEMGLYQENSRFFAQLGIDVSKMERMLYIIAIECKDKKYRYTISDVKTELYSENENEIMPDYPLNRLSHISVSEENIKKLEAEIADKKIVDISLMKKKERKTHEEEIEKLSNEINGELSSIVDQKKWLSKEISKIYHISESLKASMCVNNNF